MSDDLISRQTMIDEMRKMYHAAEKWGQEAEGDTMKARAESCMATLVEMHLRAKKLPSAERRGKWVPYEFGNRLWHKCTACGVADKYIDQVTRADGTIHELVAKRPYCPNCGAKMENG